MAHRHRPAVDTEIRPFAGPIQSAAKQVPQAHGGCMFIDRCRCGAERHSNTNGGHRERGAWVAR